MVARSGEDAEASPVFGAAMHALQRLDIAHPPITLERVLAGLRLCIEPLPVFDIERLTTEQRGIFSSVRGLLSPSDRTIYLSADLTARQTPWVVYHESGHFDIDWHRDLLYLDSMYTLSPAVRKIMEREANEYAGHLQFLGTRFACEAQELPFGLEAAKTLADRYEASYESAIRRYVETQMRACFCEVFEIVDARAGTQTLKFHYFIKPRGATGYRKPDHAIGDRLPLDNPTVRLLNDGKLDHFSVCYGTRYYESTRTAYYEQVFSNTHQVFVLTVPA